MSIILHWGRLLNTEKENINPAQKSSSSYSYEGGGPLVDPFWYHTSRSLFSGLPWFLLPFGV
jgi:hypothetical protein